MNLYEYSKNRLNTNTYIELDYVRSFTTLQEIFSKEELYSNIDQPLFFKEELYNLEQEHSKFKRKDSLTNYGVLLTFLLESDQPQDLKIRLCEKIEALYDLPIYCYEVKKGRGHYICCYICERNYNFNGLEQEKKAPRERYINAKTHKLCKKTDENAVLMAQNTKKEASRTLYFSENKTRVFHFSNTTAFICFINDLKRWFMEVCVDLFGLVKEIGVSFKRFVLHKMDYEKRQKAKLCHKALEIMEKRFKEAYQALEQLDLITPNVKARLTQLYQVYNKQIQTGAEIKYKNEQESKHISKFAIDLELNKERLNGNCDLLTRKFDHDINVILKAFI